MAIFRALPAALALLSLPLAAGFSVPFAVGRTRALRMGASALRQRECPSKLLWRRRPAAGYIHSVQLCAQLRC
jgi:hypothetical protein